jgi:acyl-CoA thioesterase FadM
MSAAGFGQDILAAKAGIVGAALVSAACDFRKPISYGTQLSHRVLVAEWRERSFVVSHTFSTRNDVVAKGTETRVCLARDPDGTYRAVPIPPAFRAAVEQLEISP